MSKHKNQQQAKKNTAEDFKSMFPEIPSSYTKATFCNACGKALNGTDDLHFFKNGEDVGFCNNECFESVLYAEEISKVMKENLKPLYIRTDKSKLPIHKSKVDAILNWRPEMHNPNGLIIHGSTGKGKTRALTLLLQELIKKRLYGVKKSFKVFYSGELEREIMSQFGHNTKGYHALIDKLTKIELLVIDDFGKERFTERYEISIFNIFENRIANCLPTIMTTNYAGDSLKSLFTDLNSFEPFYRRLKEFNKIISF
ncbi:MAG: hypothetical protein R3Y47_00010 [Lachnospiraceae bacterium]